MFSFKTGVIVTFDLFIELCSKALGCVLAADGFIVIFKAFIMWLLIKKFFYLNNNGFGLTLELELIFLYEYFNISIKAELYDFWPIN